MTLRIQNDYFGRSEGKSVCCRWLPLVQSVHSALQVHAAFAGPNVTNDILTSQTQSFLVDLTTKQKNRSLTAILGPIKKRQFNSEAIAVFAYTICGSQSSTELQVQQRIGHVLEYQNLFAANNVFLIHHISFSHRYSTNIALSGWLWHKNTQIHAKIFSASLTTHLTVCATWPVKCRMVRLSPSTWVDAPWESGSLHPSNA